MNGPSNLIDGEAGASMEIRMALRELEGIIKYLQTQNAALWKLARKYSSHKYGCFEYTDEDCECGYMKAWIEAGMSGRKKVD